MRIGIEREIRNHRSQVQHGCELNSEFAGRVHCHAELERLTDARGLDAGADSAPKSRVQQDDVYCRIQRVCGELLEVDDHGIGR